MLRQIFIKIRIAVLSLMELLCQTKRCILNINGYDSPIGAVGIIYIGGMGVALNYWDNEELTKNSFITHKKYGRLYYTGDLGRWNKDGYIEFIGRKDFQVKLNGYRVELEEIAAKINNIKGIDKAVVNLQNNKDHDYLIGYIVPEQKINKKEINSEEFKLKQRGLLNDIKVSYNLHPKLDEQDYRLRKSYRKFSAGKINLDLITKTYNKLKENICAGSIDTNKLELEHLESLLGVISGIQLEDRALPKYRYPSGGSTYSVRCFVNIGEQIGNIQTGYYYYHPIKQTLCLISSAKSEETEIYLIANWEAIKPLYGDASEKLALQEAGHMLSLLLTELDKQGFGYKLDTKKQDLDDNNSLLGKLIIGGNKREIPAIDLSLNYLTKDGNIYKSTDSTRECIINTQDIFAKNQELTQLLSNGSYLLVQEGIRENDQVILSGLLFQRLGEELYKANIGSCMIGLKPYEGTLYTMVIGSIEEEDKELAESRIITQSIAEAINNELKDILPEYMIPYDYSILESLPLTASGKIDTKQLRYLEFVGDTYIAPTTELEKHLCDIWQEILNIKRVGIKDDFFKLGGDSISVIKLISKVNIEFKSSIKIKDIFEYKTIEGLCVLVTKLKNDFVYKDFMIKEINQDKLYETFAMNNVQQAYYLGRGDSFDLGNIGTHSYTESIYKELDVSRLEVSLNKLIERHLSLRTIFTDKGQLYLAKVPYVKIVYYELTSFDELISIRNKLAHKVYDPGTFPIFDFIVSKLGSEYILHISIDALIMDAMSFTIFFKEWRCLYNDIEYKLPELKLSYRDYIIEYEKIRKSKLFSQAREYWGNKANLYQLDLKLPILKEAHEVKDSTFARVTKTIANSIWNQVLEKTLNLNISPTALLLYVYGEILGYWSAQNKVTINLTLFNRLPLHAQIHDILGDFTVLELFNYNDSQTDSIKKC